MYEPYQITENKLDYPLPAVVLAAGIIAGAAATGLIIAIIGIGRWLARKTRQ